MVIHKTMTVLRHEDVWRRWHRSTNS